MFPMKQKKYFITQKQSAKHSKTFILASTKKTHQKNHAINQGALKKKEKSFM